jgi:hypothetical protein
MVIMRAFFTMSLAGGAAHTQFVASIKTGAMQKIHPLIIFGILLDTANWKREQ